MISLNSNPPAPIVLFVYNRPAHTRRTVEALLTNKPASVSSLIVFSDGAKSEEAVPLVAQVRDYIDKIEGFNSVTVVKRDKNWGLAGSIIDGVTQVVNQYGKIIVLEDDIITSPYFLDYMNDALDLYENEEKVASVNAYMYPIEGLPETFFLRAADCWGWGTWRRAWALFEYDGSKLLHEVKRLGLVDIFNFGGTYPYSKMLKDQVRGKNDSWAVRWAASVLINNKYGLYPGKSMVENIGIDGTGRHCGKDEASFRGNFFQDSRQKIVYKEPCFDPRSYALICSYFKENFSRRCMGKILTISFDTLKRYVMVGIVSSCLREALDLLRKLLGHITRHRHPFYPSFQDALNACRSNYEDSEIVDVVANKTQRFASTLKVAHPKINDASIYGMYSLLYCIQNRKEQDRIFTVLDIGGACGAEYFRFKSICGDKISLRWYVLETSLMANKSSVFANNELNFFSFDKWENAAQRINSIDLVYMSGVLQYFEEPMLKLTQFLNYMADYVYLGRLTLSETALGLTYIVQKTFLSDHGIGPLPDGLENKRKSIPFVIVPKSMLLGLLSKNYDVISEFGDVTGKLHGLEVWNGGLLAKRKCNRSSQILIGRPTG